MDVNRVHVLVKGRMTAEGDASMIADIDENGFEQLGRAEAAAMTKSSWPRSSSAAAAAE